MENYSESLKKLKEFESEFRKAFSNEKDADLFAYLRREVYESFFDTENQYSKRFLYLHRGCRVERIVDMVFFHFEKEKFLQGNREYFEASLRNFAHSGEVTLVFELPHGLSLWENLKSVVVGLVEEGFHIKYEGNLEQYCRRITFSLVKAPE